MRFAHAHIHVEYGEMGGCLYDIKIIMENWGEGRINEEGTLTVDYIIYTCTCMYILNYIQRPLACISTKDDMAGVYMYTYTYTVHM